MCRGREEDQGHNSPSLCSRNKEEDGSIACELCSSKASLYCQADDAFLCRKCDRWVHGANFLAQRHIRCLLCSTCQRLTQRYLIGKSVEVILPTVVRLKESSQCDTEDSESVKQPFLFL
ncbi:B-box domain protein 31-like [Coffea eugenioides]|uniref:B-box domain protein 31-like n=1 Tax=Coffea arabica TaxID=13443 RepID=A0A6P6S3Y1_COFAR|nr:B-box domain protein 31-like [Coffea arabica]XP_027172037.1 B-box domain protein 31-like [Coffea eugenioides]